MAFQPEVAASGGERAGQDPTGSRLVSSAAWVFANMGLSQNREAGLNCAVYFWLPCTSQKGDRAAKKRHQELPGPIPPEIPRLGPPVVPFYPFLGRVPLLLGRVPLLKWTTYRKKGYPYSNLEDLAKVILQAFDVATEKIRQAMEKEIQDPPRVRCSISRSASRLTARTGWFSRATHFGTPKSNLEGTMCPTASQNGGPTLKQQYETPCFPQELALSLKLNSRCHPLRDPCELQHVAHLPDSICVLLFGESQHGNHNFSSKHGAHALRQVLLPCLVGTRLESSFSLRLI